MIKATVNSETFEVDQNPEGDYFLLGRENDFKIVSVSPYEFVLRNGAHEYQVFVTRSDHRAKKYTLKIQGKKFDVSLEDRLDLLLHKMGLANMAREEVSQMKAPMPGLILEVIGEKGSKVAKGDKILVLEAMKMENVIKAPADGIISKVLVATGDSVNKNQVLVQFE